MSKLRPRALLGAALITSAIVALPATASATTLPAPAPAGGSVDLQLTGSAASSLDRQRVTVSASKPAKRTAKVLEVPASTVRFGRDKVLTTNSGSIVFRKGSRSVRFSALSTHLSNRIRIRASINGETKTVLTAERRKTRVTFQGDTARLHATKLRLTTAGAREIRTALKLDRLGRGTLVSASGTFTREATAPAPSPGPKPVGTPGKLVWQQTNVYPGASGGTWLGYVTVSAPIGTLGSFTPSGEAVGDTVTPASQRGPSSVYTTTFPMASSTANAVTRTGSIRYSGVVTYSSPAAPAGHGFTFSIQNPRIEFDGSATARLYASGLRTAGGVGGGASTVVPYDESQPVFTLNVGAATTQANPDNTTTLKNVAPSVFATDHVFPGNYAAGAGPDRTPNTFGSFDITVPNPAVSTP